MSDGVLKCHVTPRSRTCWHRITANAPAGGARANGCAPDRYDGSLELRGRPSRRKVNRDSRSGASFLTRAGSSSMRARSTGATPVPPTRSMRRSTGSSAKTATVTRRQAEGLAYPVELLSVVTSDPRYPAEGLVPYDPSWPARYAELASTLQRSLGAAWRIEHIGSTSVPGLLAKPVIDLALRIPEHTSIGDDLHALARAGWTDLTRLPTHQVLFRLDHGGVRRAVAHLFTAVQWSLAPQRLFADWLRTHPDDRDAYARLKRDLRARGLRGHDYTAAKAAFVHHVVIHAVEPRSARRPISSSWSAATSPSTHR